MAYTNAPQRNFNAGEVSPSLAGRTDLAKYAAGLRTCRNLLPLRSGGVTSRPGTDYVSATIASAGRLIPFVYNAAQSYVLVFTNLAVQVVQDGALIGVTVVTPYVAADLPDLRYVQSADVMTLVHPSYPPYNLKRVAALTWTLTAITFASSIPQPAGLFSVGGAAGAFTLTYQVTWTDNNTGQEGPPSATLTVAAQAIPTQAVPLTVSWTPVAGYTANLYRQIGTSGYGLIGAGKLAIQDDFGQLADYTIQPPIARNPFPSANNYPAAVGYYQERIFLGGTNSKPETLYGSHPGDYTNFTVRSPVQDDDAITATLVARKVNAILHVVDAGSLFVLTKGSEWVIRGDAADIVKPTAINARKYGEHGASGLAPIIIDQKLLFVQARNAIVRAVDVGPQTTYYGYRNTDLTLFANHLFDGHTIVDWGYAEIPHSVIWAVRDDGVLLSLTYVEDQQVLAWARHDTDGTVENVCVIPEADEDRLYLIVTRDSGRCLERMRPTFWTDIRSDAAFMDACESYDGRNTGTATMTLSGGSSFTLSGGVLWTTTETLTLTCDVAYFTAGDVGSTFTVTDDDDNTYTLTIAGYTSAFIVTGTPTDTVPVVMRGTLIPQWRYDRALTLTASAPEFSAADIGTQFVLTGDDGTIARIAIAGYTSTTVVQGYPTAMVAASLRNTATVVWSRAVDSVSGLTHLEGQNVSIFADGYVVASPNNPAYPTRQVVSGAVDLGGWYVVVYVGLPYTSDLQTLDLDSAEGPSVKAAAVRISKLVAVVDESRGIWARQVESDPTDDSVDGFNETKLRDQENYDVPNDLFTGAIDIDVATEWSKGGRVMLRQVDPIPMTVLAVIPTGDFPGRG